MDSIGYMLQGVSQQDPHVRSEGQVTEQVNMISDVNRGLSSRPPTVLKGAISPTQQQAASVSFEMDGTQYRAVFQAGSLPRVIRYDGTAMPVTGTGAAYSGNNIAAYLYSASSGDVLYVANRDRTVAMQSSPTQQPMVTNWAFISVLGGAFSRTYQASVKIGSTRVTAEYSTPSGQNAGDAAKASAEYIATKLITDLSAALSAASVSAYTMTRARGNIIITSTTLTISDVETQDGDAGTYMRHGLAKAKTVEDLPQYAINGAVIKITGDGAADDDVWLRFAAATVVEGLWAGTWEEWYNPSEPAFFDNATMPHALSFDGTTFTFSPASWAHRRVGCEDNQKTPSFVGAKIRDISETQGRLLFSTSASTVVGSRTDHPLDFWFKTATTSVASDRIDTRGTASGSDSLEWMVKFDKDIFVFSDKAQFMLSGSGTITSNSAMALSTNYTVDSGCRPLPIGRTIMLPYGSGSWAGINEYYTTDDYATNAVNDVNKTAKKYIAGGITEMAALINEGLVFIRTDAAGSEGTLYVYKYMWENTTNVQSAWGKWTFPGTIRHIYTSRGKLFIWTVKGSKELLLEMDVDAPSLYGFSYSLNADAVQHRTMPASGSLVITSELDDLRFTVMVDDPTFAHGGVVIPSSTSSSGGVYTYTFNLDGREWMAGAELYFGQAVKWWVIPTPPVPRGYQGVVLGNVELVIAMYYIRYENSGSISAYSISKHTGENLMSSTEWFPMEDDGTSWNASVNTGTLDVSWGEYSQLADLRIQSDDIRPASIREVKYDADKLRSGR